MSPSPTAVAPCLFTSNLEAPLSFRALPPEVCEFPLLTLSLSFLVSEPLTPARPATLAVLRNGPPAGVSGMSSPILSNPPAFVIPFVSLPLGTVEMDATGLDQSPSLLDTYPPTVLPPLLNNSGLTRHLLALISPVLWDDENAWVIGTTVYTFRALFLPSKMPGPDDWLLPICLKWRTISLYYLIKHPIWTKPNTHINDSHRRPNRTFLCEPSVSTSCL